ncbi:hypothetical protein L204_104020 [Cryptococcus depauperatus]
MALEMITLSPLSTLLLLLNVIPLLLLVTALPPAEQRDGVLEQYQGDGDVEYKHLGSAVKLKKRSKGYNNPKDNGGYMLTIVNGTYPEGLGEPLNVIVSADSDKEVLVKSLDKGGFLNYMLAAGLGEECLGQHLGSSQLANLGDGVGNVTEVEELRYNYGDPYVGTCQETFNGGLHLRYWIQKHTGAYFLAVSLEKSLTELHDIPPNGYDYGRDQLIGNLTGQAVDSLALTNTSTLSGTVSYNNYTYQTDVQYAPGLLSNSSDDINHYITVEENGRPAIDGLVAVLTVKITQKPASSWAMRFTPLPILSLIPVLLTWLFVL